MRNDFFFLSEIVNVMRYAATNFRRYRLQKDQEIIRLGKNSHNLRVDMPALLQIPRQF